MSRRDNIVRAIRLSWWLLFDALIILALLLGFLLYWSYGEKKQLPPSLVTDVEEILESINPNLKVFIGSGEVEFTSFSKGLDISLKNSYMYFDDNTVASVPEIKLKLKPSELFYGNINFLEIRLERPQFVVTKNASADEYSSTATKDIFNIYKDLVYELFNTVDKSNKSVQIERVVLRDAIFSLNNKGKYESWKINRAWLNFFTLQNTTYLSTRIITELQGKKTEITINSRLLDKDRMMFKAEYEDLSSQVISNFVVSLDWFNELSPLLNGTATMVLEKEGTASSVSLDNMITFERPDLKGTEIGFKGVFDLIPDDNQVIRPSIKADVSLKDVNMQTLPQIWPEKYGTEVRADVLKNYTKGTFKNVVIKLNYVFEDAQLEKMLSEKFAIEGDIINTDVIYNPTFPALEKVDGHFYYDGDNVNIDIIKAHLGNLNFEKTKAMIAGINAEDTVLDIKGLAKGEISSLRPLMAAILKGKDKQFFYNTREITADSEIKFRYKDNINEGFDPEYLEMDIKAKLKNPVIKNAIKGVDVTAEELDMVVDNEHLNISGAAKLNGAPAQLGVKVGMIKENEVEIDLSALKTPPSAFENALPGISKYVTGLVDLEFEYRSVENRNYFAAKVDAKDAGIAVPYISWNKDAGAFTTISAGGQYISDRAIEISEMQIVSKSSITNGSAVISLSENLADEVYLNKLKAGRNDALLYLSHLKDKVGSTYKLKIEGNSFDASRIIDGVNNASEGKSAFDVDMDLNKLYLDRGITLNKVKASIRCGYDKCSRGDLNASIEQGGTITGSLRTVDSGEQKGIRNFQINSDNAGAIINGLGFSNNIEGGQLNVVGTGGRVASNASDGVFEINDFKITKAPLLAKLFSLASLTGFLNILTGSGVQMDKLKGLFLWQDDKVRIEKMRAYGNSIGLTMSGNIDLRDYNVNLSGAVTPSYSINSFLGDIPLLGYVFKGREGEGLIATTYKMSGKYPDIDISVNPLSALTPGIIRNIWLGSDDDEISIPEADNDNSKKKEKPKGFRVRTKNDFGKNRSNIKTKVNQ